ncbi:hypothetical protein MGH68_11155 [Erysipelothrix sp. D19-032]
MILAYFQSYVSDDLYAVAQKVSLTKTDVVTLVKNAFEIAWTSPENKMRYLQEVDAYLAQQ